MTVRGITHGKNFKDCPDLPNIAAFRLSRNFGKEAALCAALDFVKGNACIIMDSDLQHPPEIIPQMVSLWENEGYDIVEGVKPAGGMNVS